MNCAALINITTIIFIPGESFCEALREYFQFSDLFISHHCLAIAKATTFPGSIR
jgi:hypothetical protein